MAPLRDRGASQVRPPTAPPVPSLSMLVAVEPEGEGQVLVRELQRTRGVVTHHWPVPERFAADADVILSVYMPGLHDRLPWMPGEATSALVILLPQHGNYDFRAIGNCSPDAVLFRPWQPHQVATVIGIARSQFLYARRLRARVSRLDENIRAARDIDRAKTILVESRKMTEEEAYAFLRTQAMKKRISVAALATAFVDSYGLLN
jgi:AmiR/NasT family two-component response regulator